MDVNIFWNALDKVLSLAKDLTMFGAKLGAKVTGEVAKFIPQKAARMAKKVLSDMPREDKIKLAVACCAGLCCFCTILSLGKKK